MEKLVQKVCRKLDITQKELGVLMDISKPTIERWSANNEGIPKSSKNHLALILENYELRKDLSSLVEAVQIVKKYEKKLT